MVRYAERHLLAVSFHDPPRMTRLPEPVPWDPEISWLEGVRREPPPPECAGVRVGQVRERRRDRLPVALPGAHAVLAPVDERRRSGRHMVDDEVGHDHVVGADACCIVPVAQAMVDGRVIHWIESGVGAVDGVVEREQMNSSEYACQRAFQQLEEAVEVAGQPVDVCDQLGLGLHDHLPVQS